MRLLMRCLASRTSENSPSETVWKFGIDPESGLRSGQEGSKKSRSAASWRQRRVLETPSAIFQTVSPRTRANTVPWHRPLARIHGRFIFVCPYVSMGQVVEQEKPQRPKDDGERGRCQK